MNLTTPEQFLIMALHQEKGRFAISDIHLNYGLIGSILLDLSINEEITIEEKYLKTTGKIVSSLKASKDVLGIISSSPKQRNINSWISRLARKTRLLKWDILQYLELKNVVKIEHKKFLGLIPYRKCYLINKHYRQELLNNLRNLILFQREIANEDLVLLALVEACQMYKHLAQDKHEVKTIKEKLKVIIKESPIAKGVSEVIKHVQAAVIISVIAATTAATASHSH